MLTLSYLAEETGRADYLKLCREWLDYVLNDMPRTEEAGIQHEVTGSPNTGQLWDDTLYMTVLFVARMGIVLKEEECIQESIRQFLVHLKYLTDPATGLFFHGWTFEGAITLPGPCGHAATPGIRRGWWIIWRWWSCRLA